MGLGTEFFNSVWSPHIIILLYLLTTIGRESSIYAKAIGHSTHLVGMLFPGTCVCDTSKSGTKSPD